MNIKIKSALISVYYKEGLEPIIKALDELGILIYSTGGTQQFIESLGIPSKTVESLTGFPSILGGRVKTLHPAVFGGILGRRDNENDRMEMLEYTIPEIDLVIVDLYPFEETLAKTKEDSQIIEKIDVGGPSMIRAAAKNHRQVAVVGSKNEYQYLLGLLKEQGGETSLEQRRLLAAKAFEVCAHYDVVISKYFNPVQADYFLESIPGPKTLRYGENPHQSAVYYGKPEELFEQLNGKELSYNNLVDIDAALQLISEFAPPQATAGREEKVFAIIKHSNVCGIAARSTVKEAWDQALAGDPESAFGGVLVCNGQIDKDTAAAIHEIFFEAIIAPGFEPAALDLLKSKKNRILLQQKSSPVYALQYKSLLNGVLVQQTDQGNYSQWKEKGGRETTAAEKEDLIFANLVCKHLKSNAIALVKKKKLVGKGCGQTSRIDSLRQALEKARQFGVDLHGAVLASDAFFPFNDCVQVAHAAGIEAFIQPGGSVRDQDSIDYCLLNKLPMVITGTRHFRH